MICFHSLFDMIDFLDSCCNYVGATTGVVLRVALLVPEHHARDGIKLLGACHLARIYDDAARLGKRQ